MKSIFSALIALMTMLWLPAHAQSCNWTIVTGGCAECGGFAPAAARYGGDCYGCSAICYAWRSADDAAANDKWAHELGYDVSKKQLKDGVVTIGPRFEVPVGSKPFASVPQILQIAQINPHAAITLVAFLPERFAGVSFLDGKGGAPRVATVESVQLVLDQVTDEEAYARAGRALPEDRFIEMRWNFTKVQGGGLWKFTSVLKDKEGYEYGPVYPNIVIRTTADKPYQALGWTSE